MKIIDVINRIMDFHCRLDHSRFDKVLYGETDRECTGVVTTCCCTVDVIRQAAAVGANLIVCHEDLFFTSFDDPDLIAGVALVDEKKRVLDECGITVWRNHDHIHGNSNKPFIPGKPGEKPNVLLWKNRPSMPREKTDYIFYGIMKVLGWEEYVQDDIKKPLLYEIPETDVPSLCRFFMDKFHLNGLRIVGDAKAPVRRVFFAEHMNDRSDEALYQRMSELNADVFVPLEIVDWTLSEYVRDAVALGQRKAIIEMGHFNCEEPGMEWMAQDWLPRILGQAVPITFIRSGDSFSYMVR